MAESKTGRNEDPEKLEETYELIAQLMGEQDPGPQRRQWDDDDDEDGDLLGLDQDSGSDENYRGSTTRRKKKKKKVAKKKQPPKAKKKPTSTNKKRKAQPAAAVAVAAGSSYGDHVDGGKTEPESQAGPSKKKKTSGSATKSKPTNEDGFATGAWTAVENAAFLRGLELFGRDLNAIQRLVGTRSVLNIGSRIQKHFVDLYAGHKELPERVLDTGLGHTRSVSLVTPGRLRPGRPLDPLSATAVRGVFTAAERKELGIAGSLSKWDPSKATQRAAASKLKHQWFIDMYKDQDASLAAESRGDANPGSSAVARRKARSLPTLEQAAAASAKALADLPPPPAAPAPAVAVAAVVSNLSVAGGLDEDADSDQPGVAPVPRESRLATPAEIAEVTAVIDAAAAAVFAATVSATVESTGMSIADATEAVRAENAAMEEAEDAEREKRIAAARAKEQVSGETGTKNLALAMAASAAAAVIAKQKKEESSGQKEMLESAVVAGKHLPAKKRPLKEVKQNPSENGQKQLEAMLRLEAVAKVEDNYRESPLYQGYVSNIPFNRQSVTGFQLPFIRFGDLTMLQCESFAPRNPAYAAMTRRRSAMPPPFFMTMRSNALLVMDVHCHSSKCEVIGLLGGRIDSPILGLLPVLTAKGVENPNVKGVEVVAAYPVKALGDSNHQHASSSKPLVAGDSTKQPGAISSTAVGEEPSIWETASGEARKPASSAEAGTGSEDGDEDRHTNVEMDPVDSVRVIEAMRRDGLQVVGWYHSHPTFQPDPSVKDCQNHALQQIQHVDPKTGEQAFIGMIVGAYDTNLPNDWSIINSFVTVGPGSSSSTNPAASVPRPVYMPPVMLKDTRLTGLAKSQLSELYEMYEDKPDIRLDLDSVWREKRPVDVARMQARERAHAEAKSEVPDNADEGEDSSTVVDNGQKEASEKDQHTDRKFTTHREKLAESITRWTKYWLKPSDFEWIDKYISELWSKERLNEKE